ncbi:MAG TPA: orotidine-5'-phosphate decarboxylase [Methanocella sp.]|nr:orotidine-5'-phosphate decarboxylase [Methanocella sp.]
MINARSKLIIALDVTDREKALAIAEKLGPAVDAIKINYPLALACGLEVIGDIKRYASVIADFKVADIPSINRLICEETFEAGADAVICQGFTGRDSIEACIDIAAGFGKEIYVVTEMSHPGATDFLQAHAMELVDMARSSGASGIIAPATRPERLALIRQRAGKMKILSPGVGAQGGDASIAIRSGADFVIVGRSIYNAPDPYQAARELIDQLSRADDDRNF